MEDMCRRQDLRKSVTIKTHHFLKGLDLQSHSHPKSQ